MLFSDHGLSIDTILKLIMIFIVIQSTYNISVIHGDGLSQANMVRSQNENNEAALFFGISPLLLKSDNTNKYTIEFQLYNVANQTLYSNATYHISIVKRNYSLGKDQEVLDGTFITRNGFLILNINNSNTRSLQKAVSYPLIFRTNNNDNVNLTIPFRLESGQYRIRSIVDIPHEQHLSFNTIWQEGEIKSKNFTLQDQKYNITAISYYDKVKNLVFNPRNKTFTWEMPFEYNRTRVDDGRVRVHQELIVPDRLIKALNGSGFNITMNGQRFDEAIFSVDPYTLKNKTIVHYVPKDNALFEISNSNGTLEANKIVRFSITIK